VKDVPIYVKNIIKSIRRRRKKRSSLRSGDIEARREAGFNADIAVTLKFYRIQTYSERDNNG